MEKAPRFKSLWNFQKNHIIDLYSPKPIDANDDSVKQFFRNFKTSEIQIFIVTT